MSTARIGGYPIFWMKPQSRIGTSQRWRSDIVYEESLEAYEIELKDRIYEIVADTIIAIDNHVYMGEYGD